MSHERKVDDATKFRVDIEPAGWTFLASADKPILQAALEADVILPSSCRNGTCRACMCRLLAGSVTYRVEWPGVSPDEKRDGWILPCVAHATSALAIEAPDATHR